MTEAAIRAALPPSDFGVSTICVGAPVERDEQDELEQDMEEEVMEEVGEMGESAAQESGEDEVTDMTTSTQDAGDVARGGRVHIPSFRNTGEMWSQ